VLSAVITVGAAADVTALERVIDSKELIGIGILVASGFGTNGGGTNRFFPELMIEELEYEFEEV
jgi:hypothetical protein